MICNCTGSKIATPGYTAPGDSDDAMSWRTGSMVIRRRIEVSSEKSTGEDEVLICSSRGKKERFNPSREKKHREKTDESEKGKKQLVLGCNTYVY